MSQHAFVQLERARGRAMRPQVDPTLFDGSHGQGSQPFGSTSCSRLSHASTF